MITHKYVISLGAICLGVLCCNFDAFAAASSQGRECRLAKCAGFRGCLQKDTTGPLKDASVLTLKWV